jgi:hypothetical protein
MTPEEQKNFDELKAENETMRKLLKGVLNSCVHPEVAFRATFVEVKPIRNFLKRTERHTQLTLDLF